MGWCMLNNFDTYEEAIAYVEKIVKNGDYEKDRLIIFDDKEFPQLGKRYSVNYD